MFKMRTKMLIKGWFANILLEGIFQPQILYHPFFDRIIITFRESLVKAFSKKSEGLWPNNLADCYFAVGNWYRLMLFRPDLFAVPAETSISGLKRVHIRSCDDCSQDPADRDYHDVIRHICNRCVLEVEASVINRLIIVQAKPGWAASEHRNSFIALHSLSATQAELKIRPF